MPNWRKPAGRKGWPLHRVGAPQSEDWSAIRQGERHGVVLVLLGLAWWKAATADGTAERDDYQATVQDFSWVMSQLLNVAPACLLPEGSTLGHTSPHPPVDDAGGSLIRHTPATSQQHPPAPGNTPSSASEPVRARRGQKRAAESDEPEDPARATRGRKKNRS
ncbi:hypothetical protein SCHPADRAFT_947171 [Schizopora paradoxa]|uniref:Uncharacterized protein n=1 Tax=Schizopora paradoxa TaxID=27342 RepID=A0A0H2R1C1_9AGAM|nr:hypothetical protein SCHPADRAFT_947171 [Schizopora paradoxa]